MENARVISQPASRHIVVKILGMIGGTGPESTVEYYRRLIAAFQKRMKTTDHVPPIIINSVDYRKLVDWFTANELAQVTEFLVTEIERLERAGADFAVIEYGSVAAALRYVDCRPLKLVLAARHSTL